MNSNTHNVPHPVCEVTAVRQNQRTIVIMNVIIFIIIFYYYFIKEKFWSEQMVWKLCVMLHEVRCIKLNVIMQPGQCSFLRAWA